MSEIREWLERLYSNAPGYFGITAFAGGRPRKTKWFATSEIDAAEKTIQRNADVADLYLSVATHESPQETRGGEKTVLSIPGFWADLDIGEFGHKPASLPNPSTEEEALSIVDGLPEPSMIMHSGGGLQGFWIFEDGPWVLESIEEKEKAKKAIQEWGNLLEQQGKERGFHVDKIADLARILRVPGSINHKQGGYRPVVVRWADKQHHKKEKLVALGIPDKEHAAYDQPSETDDKFPLTWNQILAPHGYKQCGESSWVRPGKRCDEGISLNVPEFAPYVITNFSESDPLIPAGRGTKLTKLKLYALLNHGGDIGKAEKVLSKRKLKLTPASSITPKPVHWLWEGRIAEGTLALLAGREGIGKSTLAYTLVADITKGKLEGAHNGVPRSVIIVATEDSWEFTIVPRLMAAKANLDRVFRVEPTDPDEYGISLPRDIEELSYAARDNEVTLILLDPLMSRVDSKLDTHKDSEVRQALEPLVKMGNEAGSAVLGLIHVNKSGSADPLSTLMGSRAFSAVARAVLYVVQDPENPDVKVMGQPKNNLGRSDLPDLAYTLQQVTVGEWEGEDVTSVQLNWAGDKPAGHIKSLMNPKTTTKTKQETAEEWLEFELATGRRLSKELVEAGSLEGFNERLLRRALEGLGGKAIREGFGKNQVSYWELPNLAEPTDTIAPWDI
jgi:energy-coupling factor transporter ATP-binding protein EcfA2